MGQNLPPKVENIVDYHAPTCSPRGPVVDTHELCSRAGSGGSSQEAKHVPHVHDARPIMGTLAIILMMLGWWASGGGGRGGRCPPPHGVSNR